jgi:hypothetical protein
MRRVFLASIALALVTSSWGHLVSNSLKLSRSGPYRPGDTLTVSFGVDVPHAGCNVDLRLDGKKWQTIKSNISAPSKQTYSYKWTVGKDTTNIGRLRICQLNGTTCTDADSTNDPQGAKNGARYVLISPIFMIMTPATSLAPQAAKTDLSLTAGRPGSLELAFRLPSDQAVVMAAYDARGREAAVLLDARYPAGSHRLSFYSESLRAHPDWVVRLSAGGRVLALHP